MHISDPKLLLAMFAFSMVACLVLPTLFWRGVARFRAWRNKDVNWQLMQYRKQQKRNKTDSKDQ